MARYLPIAEHGVIGDLHTVALVGTDGTIDWLCLPRFDSPSVFASILDADRGGFFAVRTRVECSTKQLYHPDTCVLITRFLAPDGVGEVVDYMPVKRADEEIRRHRLLRRITTVRGRLPYRVEVRPAFDYARAPHETHVVDRGVVFESAHVRLSLHMPTVFTVEDGAVVSEFTLDAGESATFVLEMLRPDAPPPPPHDEDEARDALERTIRYWRGWLGHSRYKGRWREMVHRSALTLKLLTYRPTGAIVAAPTTSLPEVVGGSRNWDYRYTWIRDAAFSLFALLRLGFSEEADAFMQWLTELVRESMHGPLQIMYGIDGRSDLSEEELTHLEGYMGSAPVRIGNAAAEQLQLDIYGELIDSIYLYNKYAEPISHDTWIALHRVVEWLCDNWDQADEGIWETRGGRQRFTYSRLMAWVAIERAIRVARQRGLPGDLVRWLRARDEIYGRIMERGWHEERRVFVQHENTDVLDASVLLMPLVKFVGPTDPRWLSTLDAISEELVSDSLVYRYNPEAAPDGLEGREGTFSICSFWYVEALARAGRLQEARLAFEKMLTYANHLGLYAEEIGPSGEQLGNFPQAFTHLSLISAAFTLDRLLP